jgi:predicted dehydrogenase
MNEKKLRVVVVGMGSIGLRHARLCRERADLSVEICDVRPEGLREAASTLGAVRAWSNIEEALASHPDIVIVATPHDTHAPVSEAALNVGAHVLCEKPMSDTLASARSMLEAARTSKRILRIAFMLHFHPGARRMKELLRSGTLGTPVFGRYSVGSYITLENSRSRYQQALFGALVMDYAHGIDLMQWLFDRPPAGVYARGIQGGALELTSTPNVLSAVLDYDTPLISELHIDYVAKPQTNVVEVVGDQGWASLDIMSGVLTIGNRAKAETLQEKPVFERDNMYREQMAQFLALMRGGTGDLTTPEAGVQSMACVDAILRSLRSAARAIL